MVKRNPFVKGYRIQVFGMWIRGSGGAAALGNRRSRKKTNGGLKPKKGKRYEKLSNDRAILFRPSNNTKCIGRRWYFYGPSYTRSSRNTMPNSSILRLAMKRKKTFNLHYRV